LSILTDNFIVQCKAQLEVVAQKLHLLPHLVFVDAFYNIYDPYFYLWQDEVAKKYYHFGPFFIQKISKSLKV
jgi:hypothetical protein